MYKFLPSYVGSKSFWVDKLLRYKDRHFVEIFSGSAVLSANLASSAVLNDKDPYVFRILSNFQNLIVPELFTPQDYFNCRGKEGWWK